MRSHLVWPRVGVAVLILALVTWWTGAVSIWAFLRYNQDFHDTSVLDVAFLPLHWRDYQRRRGDDYIERARKLEQKDWRQIFFLLRVGVAKSPGNLDGRRLLAQMYGAFGNAPAGLKVLEDGLARAKDDLPYLQTYLGLLIGAQQDEKVRQLADEALARSDLSPDTARAYALAATWASYLRGHYKAAGDYLARPGVLAGTEGRLLQTRLEWDQGFRDLALTRLRGMIGTQNQAEAAHELLFNCLRELGRQDEAAEAALLRTTSFPESLDARINLLLMHRERGEQARFERELERVLRDFPNDARLVDKLGTLAVQFGDVALAERVAALVRSQNLSVDYASMLVLQTRLAAREYDAVIAGIQRLEAEPSPNAAAQAGWRAGVLAVAYFGRGDTDLGELNVGRLLAEDRPRPDVLFDIGGRLQGIQANDAARRVFARLVELSPQLPLFQPALTRLVELEMQTGAYEELPRHLATLLEMRKPALDLLQEAYDELGSDRLLFSADRTALLQNLRTVLATRERAVR